MLQFVGGRPRLVRGEKSFVKKESCVYGVLNEVYL